MDRLLRRVAMYCLPFSCALLFQLPSPASCASTGENSVVEHLGKIQTLCGYYISDADSFVMEAASGAMVGPGRGNGPFISFFRLRGRENASEGFEEYATANSENALVESCRQNFDSAAVVIGGAFEHKSSTGRLRIGISVGELSRKYAWSYDVARQQQSTQDAVASATNGKGFRGILPDANDRAILYGIFSEMEFIDSDRCHYGVAIDLAVANGKPFWVSDDLHVKFGSMRGTVEAKILTRESLLAFGPFVRLSFNGSSIDFEQRADVSHIDRREYTSIGTEVLVGFAGHRHVAKHTLFQFKIGGLLPIRRSVDVTTSVHSGGTSGMDNYNGKYVSRPKKAVAASFGISSRIGNVWELNIGGGGTARDAANYVFRGQASIGCEF
ncbi:MAG: hypothetical protein LBB38_00560 [Puniceicoccales bacterium]|jgi:hypothetical protein|nr:hypothetical protein [Puniceicoccales bacterium]